VCFLYNLLDELVPIFAAAPISTGGLNLSASELSGPLSTSGIFLMVRVSHPALSMKAQLSFVGVFTTTPDTGIATCLYHIRCTGLFMNRMAY
jgi:hypothetical protein